MRSFSVRPQFSFEPVASSASFAVQRVQAEQIATLLDLSQSQHPENGTIYRAEEVQLQLLPEGFAVESDSDVSDIVPSTRRRDAVNRATSNTVKEGGDTTVRRGAVPRTSRRDEVRYGRADSVHISTY